MTRELQVFLLGGLRLTLGDQPVDDFSSRKSPALLSYLVATGKMHSRDALSALLWGESAEGRARASLRTVLWDLRQHLPDFVTADRETISFETEAPHWLDVAAFSVGIEAVLESGNQATHSDPLLTDEQVNAAEKALSLYRGDFLAGFHVSDASEFESWMLRKREWARQLAIQGWHRLVAHYTAKQRYMSGIDAATQLLEIAPWQEETHRHLMRLLALNGQRGAALAQFESCCAMLEEELGVEPTMETRLLYSRIRSGKPLETAARAPASSHPVHTSRDTYVVPVRKEPLIGRDSELADLKRLLSSAEAQLAALVGPGGVGKTRLAWEAARQMSEEFEDGVWFVQLEGDASCAHSPTGSDHALPEPRFGVGEADAGSPGLVFPLVRTLDVLPIDRASLESQLTDYLSQREMLLILDDFQATQRSLAWLEDLLQRAPLVRVLVISDEPVDGGPTRTLRLSGLPVPAPEVEQIARGQDPSPLRRDDALALFMERARWVAPDFELDHFTARNAGQLCQLAAGMPLAIGLIASTVKKVSLDDMLRRIERQQRVVSTDLRVDDTGRMAVAVAFGYAWELLDSVGQTSLSKLALFESGFDEQAAADVAGVSSAGLERLMRRGWLLSVGGGRFALHPTLRAAVRSRPQEPDTNARDSQRKGQGASFRRRHGAYYLGSLAEEGARLVAAGMPAVYEEIERDWRNVRRAWCDAAVADESDLLESGLRGMTHFLLRRGWLWEGDYLLEATFATLGDGDSSPLLARVLTTRARLLNERARWHIAEGVARAAAALVSKRGDLDAVWQEARAEALTEWGRTLYLQGESAAAMERLKQALSLISDGQWAGLKARLFGYLGVIAIRGERYDEAETYLRRALQLYEALGHSLGAARIHNDLGVVSLRQRQRASAESHLRRALSLAQGMGDRRRESAAYNNLGDLATARGDYERATSYCEKALQIARDLGDRWTEAKVLTQLGLILLHQGKTEIAWKRSVLAVEILRDLGDRASEARARLVAGHVFSELGMLDEAEESCRAALELQRSLDQSNLAAESLACLAHISLARSEVDEACALVNQVLDQLPAGVLSGPKEPLRVYLTCYEVLSAAEDPRARDIMRRILDLQEEDETDGPVAD